MAKETIHPEELVIKRRQHFLTKGKMMQTLINGATDTEIC